MGELGGSPRNGYPSPRPATCLCVSARRMRSATLLSSFRRTTGSLWRTWSIAAIRSKHWSVRGGAACSRARVGAVRLGVPKGILHPWCGPGPKGVAGESVPRFQMPHV